MSKEKKESARENEDTGFFGLTGSLEQNLRRMQRIREQNREEREEREEAEEQGISVYELRERKHYEENKPILIDPASIESTKLKWLWPERIPLGKITIFSGDPGLGKSYVALDIAARVSNGSKWPGEEEDAEKEEGRGEKDGESEEKSATVGSTGTCSGVAQPQEATNTTSESFEPQKLGDASCHFVTPVQEPVIPDTSTETASLEMEPERFNILQTILGQIRESGKENAEKQAQRDAIEESKRSEEERMKRKIARSAGVLVISSEDNKSDTILPRLELLGANLSNFRFMNYVKEDGVHEMFSITRHMNQLEIAVREVKNCKLVIIDPLASYLDNMGGNSLSAVRKALDPLKDLAERCGVTVILINHLNKKSGAAIHRSAGSISIVGLARAAWGFINCKHDPKRRLMVPLKNNLSDDSEGLVYSITNENGLVWDDEPIEIRADEAFGDQEKIRGRNPDALLRAMNWLRYKLSSGEPVPQTTIETDAREAEINLRTLRRARERLGVVTKMNQKVGQWFWALQTVQTNVVETV